MKNPDIFQLHLSSTATALLMWKNRNAFVLKLENGGGITKTGEAVAAY